MHASDTTIALNVKSMDQCFDMNLSVFKFLVYILIGIPLIHIQY